MIPLSKELMAVANELPYEEVKDHWTFDQWVDFRIVHAKIYVEQLIDHRYMQNKMKEFQLDKAFANINNSTGEELDECVSIIQKYGRNNSDPTNP
jgi:hypothetical protein